MSDLLLFFNENILSIISTLFLILCIVGNWTIKNTKIKKIILMICIIFSVFSGHIETKGLFFILIALYIFKIIQKKNNNNLFYTLIIFIICGGFFSHIIPGFNNWKLNDLVFFCKTCFPVDFYINFDKNIIICIYFLIFNDVNNSINKISIKILLKYTFITAFIVFPLAFYFKVVLLDFGKDIEDIIIFAFRNLLLVCIAEEILFRKVLFGRIIERFEFDFKNSVIINILISIIFALVHININIVHVLLIFIASYFYGFIYLKYRRIEYSILLHFFINLIHFAFFSYPYKF